MTTTTTTDNNEMAISSFAIWHVRLSNLCECMHSLTNGSSTEKLLRINHANGLKSIDFLCAVALFAIVWMSFGNQSICHIFIRVPCQFECDRSISKYPHCSHSISSLCARCNFLIASLQLKWIHSRTHSHRVSLIIRAISLDHIAFLCIQTIYPFLVHTFFAWTICSPFTCSVVRACLNFEHPSLM